MRPTKTRLQKLLYVGLGAALALVPAFTALANDGGSASE